MELTRRNCQCYLNFSGNIIKKKIEDRECDSRVFGRIIKIVKLESAGYSNIPTKQKIKK